MSVHYPNYSERKNNQNWQKQEYGPHMNTAFHKHLHVGDTLSSRDDGWGEKESSRGYLLIWRISNQCKKIAGHLNTKVILGRRTIHGSMVNGCHCSDGSAAADKEGLQILMMDSRAS